MRTIKFRGQKTTNGIWVYGSLVYSNELDAAIYYQVGKSSVKSMEWVYVNPDTIGQFTGLYDKNGKEIYEGDILLWTRKNVHIEGRQRQDFSDKCIVYYDNDKCAFRFRYELRCGACVGYLDFDDDRSDESFVEVIGDIHNNPKLLENERETNN